MRRQLAELAQAHPEYRFSVFYDQADLVREAVGSVRDSIAIGLLLAVGTIFFFIAACAHHAGRRRRHPGHGADQLRRLARAWA